MNKKQFIIKILAIIYEMLIDICVYLALIFVAIFLILPIFNIKNYKILSGSMEPTIKTYSLVLTNNNFDIEKLKENDIILFESRGEQIVHRVIKIDKENQLITTKGDANDVEDFDKLSYSKVKGKVIFKSYLLGLMAYSLSSRKNKIIFLVCFVLFSTISLFYVTKNEPISGGSK